MDIDDRILQEVRSKAEVARKAARQLAVLSSDVKDSALQAMAGALDDNSDDILQANQRDLERAKKNGITGALLDRLTLNHDRIKDMSDGLRELVMLEDPVGRSTGMWRRPNGLQIGRVRVPLGVIGIIYEARPNVTVDAAGLCLKAGNAVILRGGSEAIESNKCITAIISDAAGSAGIPAGAISLIENTDRKAAQALMRMNGLVDVLIPRGGAGLIRAVVENATVPVIETGVGNCHIYVERSADLDMATAIVINAKTQRPGVCNAAETLLVDEEIAERFIPQLVQMLEDKGVEVRGCERVRELVDVTPADETDWETEYLDYILAVRVVSGFEEALEHINQYGTGHSEAIVTRDYAVAHAFTDRVDAAAVYVNASTRFTDGNQFGLGAEIGISTQKLHARGPMGLEDLTSTKFTVYGSGQIRE